MDSYADMTPPQPTSAIDHINRQTMRDAVGVYARLDELGPAERVALHSVSDRVRGGRILDIGVGGGRTVKALQALSNDYIGVDYVPEMVAACQAKFPGVRFEHADARAMPQFEDASFDLIVFAWAGICMVDHSGRLAILKEVRRLLRPEGAFVFSSYNQNSPAYHQLFEFPPFMWSASPIKLARQILGFCRSLCTGLVNRARFKHQEIRTPAYGIINDKCHDYRTMLYYITLDNQRAQLREAGFDKNVQAYDNRGQAIVTDTTDDSITYVVAG